MQRRNKRKRRSKRRKIGCIKSRWKRIMWKKRWRKIKRFKRRSSICLELNTTTTTTTTITAAAATTTNNNLQHSQVRRAPSSFTFQPDAIKTLGQFNRSTLEFISEIGNRISAITGNKRETSFLFQKLSTCIQRFNLVAFKGTFTTTTDDEVWPSGH